MCFDENSRLMLDWYGERSRRPPRPNQPARKTMVTTQEERSMTMTDLSCLVRALEPGEVRLCRNAAQARTRDKRESCEALRSFGMLIVIACALVTAPHPAMAQHASGPTAANALAADDALSKAIRENAADRIERWLDKDWAVVSTRGEVGEGVSVFPSGIKSGVLTRTTFETSEPRVRVYGDVALVTTKVKTSGILGGKPFDVLERQTDVWLWKDSAWKCIFTHETKFPDKAG
jgi:ketosteroid isomerase-like protein